MSPDIIFFYLIIFLFIGIFAFAVIRVATKYFAGTKQIEHKDVSKVGFVVDTFHDLVSKLKEKERELEELRKKAEDRATAIEGYNENILQSVPSGVISFDEDMRITKVNAPAERILEIQAESAAGKLHADVLGKPISDLLGKSRVIERSEVRYVTPSGRRIWLGLTFSPLRNSAGQTIGQILVFTDLTHLKAIESQMELRDRLSSLGEISAGIAHELRNPMGVIAGYTKLLSKKIDDSLRPTVNAISKEITVMDRIISDFLSFAKPPELAVSGINLKKLMADCLSVSMGERGDIVLNLDVSELPSFKGDEVLLRQAFANLIQNSVEAMPQGGNLSIRAFQTTDSGGDFLSICVSDTGHGVPEELKNKIFLPFFTSKEKGTGLGLAIVHKIIITHGGSISFESTPKGTTFKIRLPM
ncbi:MAG: ATP-binding protein [Nitrospirota bacterium]